MIIVGGDVEVEEPPVDVPVDRFPAPEPRLSSTLYLTGVDGSVWDLTNGPVRAQAGVSVGPMAPQHWTRESPGLDGAAWQGFRTPAGELHLPVRVEAPDSLAWRDVDAAFAKAIDPAGEVTVTWVTPDALSRSITARYADGMDAAFDRDPLMMRHAEYPLEFAAFDPFWRSPKHTVTFGVAESISFFPGPPWALAPGNTTDAAVVSNPGDVPVWPRWTVTGPFTEVTVGVGDAVVTLEASVLSGDSRVIDMDPRVRAITDGAGDDAWLDATTAEFAAIPAGTDVPLSVDLSGGSAGVTTIAVEFTPAHRRPW